MVCQRWLSRRPIRAAKPLAAGDGRRGAGGTNTGTGTPFGWIGFQHAVLNRQYRLKTGVNELLLTNLETLPAGTYFVKASDGASSRNGKLVIQHNF